MAVPGLLRRSALFRAAYAVDSTIVAPATLPSALTRAAQENDAVPAARTSPDVGR